jgi:cytidylate kinase
MKEQLAFERCHSFVNLHLQPRSGQVAYEPEPPCRAVTISRQAGCGAAAVAQKLADYLQPLTPEDQSPWTVYDRNLVQRVLEEHHLAAPVGKFLSEKWRSEFSDTLDELFGLHPPSWILVRRIAETVLRLVRMGNVIVIGRGANVVTAEIKSVFHVRLVASLEARIKRIQETDKLSRKAALAFIEREDRGRGKYLKHYYNKDIDDPLLYHLVINTDLVPYDMAARMIGDAVIERMRVHRGGVAG